MVSIAHQAQHECVADHTSQLLHQAVPNITKQALRSVQCPSNVSVFIVKSFECQIHVRQCSLQAAPLNVPTWTGRHGEGGLEDRQPVRRFGNVTNPGRSQGPAGLPPASGGFLGASAGMKGGSAPRSSDLLAHLKQRQQNAAQAARGLDGPESSSTPTSAEVCAF